MLFAEDRHEPAPAIKWDEARARDTILRIVRDTEERFSPETFWPTHQLDAKDLEPQYTLYMGACGVIWALQHLQAQGAASLSRDYAAAIPALLAPNRAQMGIADSAPFGAYLMGDTSIRMLEYWVTPSEELASELSRLIESNKNHPARELMWGAPGTLLAALFMHSKRPAIPSFSLLGPRHPSGLLGG